MGNTIYCVDTSKKFTPMEVREAVVKCFYEAHRDILLKRSGLTEEDKQKFTETSIREIVRCAFMNAGGDFDKPTKESLFFSILELAQLARQFRDIDVIVKHFSQILKLIERL